MLGGFVGFLLQFLIWGGGIGIHVLTGIIVLYNYGIIWGLIAFGLPVVSTVFVLFKTILAGVWWFAGLVIIYIVVFIISIYLITQAEET